MASIRDVAKKAGVAVCTVSRVMNGMANVAPETKKKIEEAMEALDYVPNELARGMFKKKSDTIAMLVPNIQHPWFSSLAAEIEKELYQKGYKFMLCSTNDNVEREREYFQILKSNIVDGIICGVTRMQLEEYGRVQKPMVMLDYKVNSKIPVIVSDHELGGQLAAEEFIKSECKFVAHICSKHSVKEILSYRSHEKLDEVLSLAGIRTRRVEIQWNDFDFDGYYELAKCILESYPDIDGIMAADLPASAFLKAAIGLNRRVPQDFCVIAYDGTYVVKTNTCDVTTIMQPYSAIGKEAVRVVLELIGEKKIEETEILFPVTIRKGMTTK